MTQPVVDTTPIGLARFLLTIINNDRDDLEKIDRYVSGDHDEPYMPSGADAEYRQLAQRSITNFIPLLLSTPAQALYVDSIRRGFSSATPGDQGFTQELPEWKHWQDSRLDARQLAVHRGALKYGHSFTLTERDIRSGKVLTKGLSAMNTAAVYEDAANDIEPFAALTIVRYPDPYSEIRAARTGLARLWDGTFEYRVTFSGLADLDSVRVGPPFAHGVNACPVTRFSASMDLEGRTCGVVEFVISIQDRINQTVFDLLIAQTYGSFKVRTITGMAPPIMRWTQDLIDNPPPGVTVPEGTLAGEPIVDPEGNPVPKPITLASSRWMFAEDENVKFDAIDETPLDGYIKSLDMSIRHLSVVTQTPPHYLLGEIANLSADALHAAETSLLRRVEEFRKSFGESWERVFRIAAFLSGDIASSEDFSGEVKWRDVTMRSLSQTADALVKFKELGIPLLGLWDRMPEGTRGQVEEWMRMRSDDIAFRKELAKIDQLANTFDPDSQPASERQPASA